MMKTSFLKISGSEIVGADNQPVVPLGSRREGDVIQIIIDRVNL